jgi:hypothetical protein
MQLAAMLSFSRAPTTAAARSAELPARSRPSGRGGSLAGGADSTWPTEHHFFGVRDLPQLAAYARRPRREPIALAPAARSELGACHLDRSGQLRYYLSQIAARTRSQAWRTRD